MEVRREVERNVFLVERIPLFARDCSEVSSSYVVPVVHITLVSFTIHKRRSRSQQRARNCTRGVHECCELARQDVTDGRSFNAPDIAPLFRHRNQCMNPRLDRSQSLRQRRRFSVGRNHEKGSQP